MPHFTFYDNPLRTVIKLSDDDRKYLRQKLVAQEFKDIVAEIKRHITSQPVDVDATLAIIDGAAARVEDAYFDSLLAELELALLNGHIGDCILLPCSCVKCRAESLLDINTLSGLSPQAASEIAEAFAFHKEPNAPLAEAMKKLSEPHELEPNAEWTKMSANPDVIKASWLEHLPRWNEERKEAHAWMQKYLSGKARWSMREPRSKIRDKMVI